MALGLDKLKIDNLKEMAKIMHMGDFKAHTTKAVMAKKSRHSFVGHSPRKLMPRRGRD